MKNLIVVCIAIIPACKSSDAAKGAESCDGASTLQATLETANGFGIDFNKPDRQADIDAARKKLPKEVAFKNCKYSDRAGDTVSFASFKAGAKALDCRMAGGADATKTFKEAMMGLDRTKLKLDVSGKIVENDRRYDLVECTITPHE